MAYFFFMFVTVAHHWRGHHRRRGQTGGDWERKNIGHAHRGKIVLKEEPAQTTAATPATNEAGLEAGIERVWTARPPTTSVVPSRGARVFSSPWLSPPPKPS